MDGAALRVHRERDGTWSAQETEALEERLSVELEEEHVLRLVARDVGDLLGLVVALQRDGVEELRERLAQRQRHRRQPQHHVLVPAHPVGLRAQREERVANVEPQRGELKTKTGFFILTASS